MLVVDIAPELEVVWESLHHSLYVSHQIMLAMQLTLQAHTHTCAATAARKALDDGNQGYMLTLQWSLYASPDFDVSFGHLNSAAVFSPCTATGIINTQEGAAYLCPGTLPDTHNSILVGVEDLPHFTHGLGVCGGGGEVAIQIQAAKQASPAIMALSSVG